MDLCNALGIFLNETDRSDEAINLNEETEQKLLSINDIYNAGWYACAAGYAYHKLKQPVKVIDCANRAETYWRRVGARELGIAYRIRGLGYQLENNFDTAINTFNEAIKLLNTANTEGSNVALVLNDLAKVEFMVGSYEEAKLHYNEALRISKKKDNKNRVISYTLNLVELLLYQDKWVEAENLAREVLPVAEEIGRQELLASDCHLLAKALLKQNHNLDEALSMSRRAVEIYTRLKSPSLQSAQETLGEIEKAIHE